MDASEPLIHCDPLLLAANKPAGLAVHRSHLVGREDDYLIDRLRRMIDGPLHLVHRLDRGTSGVTLGARSKTAAALLGERFMNRSVEKTYLAIVRGWPPERGVIDYPLGGAGKNEPARPALTRWRRLAQIEVPIALGRYPRQRYSLLELQPETGRYRQLRRHLHHIHHPIIGDATHGRGEHNRLFKQHFHSYRLLLHAWRLRFQHPVDGRLLALEAPLDATWRSLLDRFGWSACIASSGESTSCVTGVRATYNPAA